MDESPAAPVASPDRSLSLARAIEWLNREEEMPSWMPPFPDRNEEATFLQKIAEWTRAVEERSPPPSPIRVDDEDDVRIGAFIDEVRESPVAVRSAVANGLHPRAAGRLAGYAGRAATLAVRTGQRVYLERAVVALAFAYQVSRDWRDVLVYYPLPYDAARRLGLDPDALFLDAAGYAPETGAQSLRGFARRPEDVKTLAVMGFRAGEDADGFRYERDRRAW
jgi:hypothetical protein